MNGRRAVVGLSLLCALLFSAFAAQGASAALGTTGFTCKAGTVKGSAKVFTDEHCTKAAEVDKGSFEHVEAPVGKATTVTGTNEKTLNETKEAKEFILQSKAGGLAAEITCLKVSSTGTATNEEGLNAKGEKEMFINGTGIITTYEKCTAPLPAGQGCKVKGETVVTNILTSTTKEKGDNVEFKPPAGKPFATITLEGCKTAGLNIAYPVNGTVLAQPNGATLEFNEKKTTEAKTLTFNGQPAGIEGSLTLSGKLAGSKDADVPLSATTVASLP